MIRVLRRNHRLIQKVDTLKELEHLKEIVWIDLQDPDAAVFAEVETLFGVSFMSQQEQAEIETSSRYVESAHQVAVNSNFLQVEGGNYRSHPVSCILKDHILFTSRRGDLLAFAETVRKLKQQSIDVVNGTQAILSLFETRIDIDADLIENISRDISGMGKQLGLNKRVDESVLLRISEFQDLCMIFRENIIDQQRVLSAMLRSEKFEKPEREKLVIALKDIDSLLDHTHFNFERLEYMQDTFLGLINIEQNKAIKFFTVASVVFMPPTLIASVYGMNFPGMPEQDWEFGYPFALGLMLTSSIATLLFFRRKGWI